MGIDTGIHTGLSSVPCCMMVVGRLSLTMSLPNLWQRLFQWSSGSRLSEASPRAFRKFHHRPRANPNWSRPQAHARPPWFQQPQLKAQPLLLAAPQHLRRYLCLSILLLAWKGSGAQGICPCQPSSALLFQCPMSSSSFLTSSSLKLSLKASKLSLAPTAFEPCTASATYSCSTLIYAAASPEYPSAPSHPAFSLPPHCLPPALCGIEADSTKCCFIGSVSNYVIALVTEPKRCSRQPLLGPVRFSTGGPVGQHPPQLLYPLGLDWKPREAGHLQRRLCSQLSFL